MLRGVKYRNDDTDAPVDKLVRGNAKEHGNGADGIFLVRTLTRFLKKINHSNAGLYTDIYIDKLILRTGRVLVHVHSRIIARPKHRKLMFLLEHN